MRRAHLKLRKATDGKSSSSAQRAPASRFPLTAFCAGVAALLLGGILIVGTAAAPQSATTATAEQASAITPDPPGTIDGAKNPELIPAEVALRMIVLAIAEPSDATTRIRSERGPS